MCGGRAGRFESDEEEEALGFGGEDWWNDEWVRVLS